MKVLHLLPSLHYGSELGGLLAHLPAPNYRDTCCVVSLGPPTCWRDYLENRGIRVECLARRGWYDLGNSFRLRRLLAEVGPDVLHIWGLKPLRTLALAYPQCLPRVVVELEGDSLPGWWDVRILFRTAACLVRSDWAAQRMSRAGIPRRLLHRVPATGAFLDGVQGNPSPPIPSPFLASLGRLERRNGLHDAIWAMDMLGYSHPDLHILLVGSGPLETELRRVSISVHHRHRAVFEADEIRGFSALQQARLCWITGRPGTGLQTALDATAAGCPVVAYDHPCLREVMEEGVTGALVPPGDMLSLARKSHALLSNEYRRLEMARNCRFLAARRWAQDAALEATQAFYRRAG